MICKLCNSKEAYSTSGYCDSCLMEIQLSFTYYIGGKEVTKEEYDKFIKETK